MTETPPPQPWPRRPARLATAVIEELVDWIVDGRVAAGEALPTESALCETFGVSRSVLREAVKAVEGMRLIRVQQGFGTTVLPMTTWDLMNPVVLAAVVRHDDKLLMLDHLLDVRSTLESHMAMNAAVIATEEQRAVLRDRMADLDAYVDDPQRFRGADVAFHDAVHMASGNLLGRAIVTTLIHEAYNSMRFVGEPSTEERRVSNEEHRQILNAIADGDADAAAEAMRRHILEAWERRRPDGRLAPADR